MKLWILRPIDNLPEDDDPWNPWYDKVFGFVVRAETEDEAREFAHKEAGDENRGEFMQRRIANTTAPWKDSKYSTCDILSPDGEPGVVILDGHSA